MDTVTLLDACRAGDPVAVETLLHAYQHWVYRIAFSILNDTAEADEATQDTFVALVRALEGYREQAAFKTWLYTIAVNVCRRRLRQRRARERLQQALHSLFAWALSIRADPEESAIHAEADAALWHAVNALGDAHRLPVILHYYHDLSTPEIAQVLGIREGTVRSRLHTARERLKAALDAVDTHMPVEAGEVEAP